MRRRFEIVGPGSRRYLQTVSHDDDIKPRFVAAIDRESPLHPTGIGDHIRTFWTEFLRSLKDRNLNGVRLVSTTK